MKRISSIVFFVVIIAALGIVLKGHAGNQKSPKALFEETCSQCHSVDIPKAEKMSKSDWKYTVSRMRSNGCAINDKEAEIIVDYLAENYGRKN